MGRQPVQQSVDRVIAPDTAGIFDGGFIGVAVAQPDQRPQPPRQARIEHRVELHLVAIGAGDQRHRRETVRILGGGENAALAQCHPVLDHAWHGGQLAILVAIGRIDLGQRGGSHGGSRGVRSGDHLTCRQSGDRVQPTAILGDIKRYRRRAATLHDRPVEQATRLRHRQQTGDIIGAGAFTEHRHPTGIATKGIDIAADPLQGRHQVKQGKIRGFVVRDPGLGPQCRMSQKAERSEPVLHRHDDHAALIGQVGAVIGRGRAPGISAAMDPHHHRQIIARRGIARRINVERQAILGANQNAGVILVPGAERIGHLRAGRPGRQRLIANRKG